MGLPQAQILDGNGNPQTVNTLAAGRQADANSAAVALSNEDVAALEALAQPVPGVISAGTIGTLSAELLTPDPARKVVWIQNVSVGAMISTSAGVSPAALNTGGCSMAGPNGFVVYQGVAAQAAIYAIADTASTPVTITVG